MHPAALITWLQAHGADRAVSDFALREARQCPSGGGCEIGCGALDDYLITNGHHDRAWTVRARDEHGQTAQRRIRVNPGTSR